ncbi:MAG: RimK family protein [bacterium]|nr:RimK family protein [bacterium]
MRNLIIVESPKDWPNKGNSFEVIHYRDYLSGEEFQKDKNIRVFNLCDSYRYHSYGYYVSLLADARGHRPTPSVATLQEMKSRPFLRLASEPLDGLIQKALGYLKSDHFELSIYFGQNLAKHHQELADELSRSFAVPMIRAKFVKKDRWQLTSVGPIALKEVSDEHFDSLVAFAQAYFKRRQRKAEAPVRFSLAILVNPEETFPPSNERALKKFSAAGQELGLEVDRITAKDLRRLGEYDALFIRETTAVNHHTFRFAIKAQSLGMVVIDDPNSIIRCTNKVYLAELLHQHHIPTPASQVLSREDLAKRGLKIPFPAILKQPDGSFSQGVVKVQNPAELEEKALSFFGDSDLILAQEFFPTAFDWRVGMINGQVLYVCRYHMARGHWQIIKTTAGGKQLDGKVDVIPLDQTPPALLKLAQEAAQLIGKGFYGLDIKERSGKFYVIEINDNPSVDAGFEDQLLKDELYLKIMNVFLERLLKKVNR